MTAFPAPRLQPSRGRVRRPALCEWVAPGTFVASLTLFAVLSCIVRDAPFHPLARVGYFDLKVYRLSAGAMLAGRPLYGIRFPGNLAFTYPPFAALVLSPLRALPVGLDEVLVTALDAVLIVAIAWWALGLRPAIDPARRRVLAFVAAAVALWCEPVNTAIGYGQIDVVIAALVVWDLAAPRDGRGRGAGIGLAAGLKLTPLIFIVYLLLAGRVRAARNAALSFAATVAAGALVLPGDSRAFWAGAFLDTSRVSGRPDAGGGPADQSLRGALLRILPGLPDHTAAWLVLAALTAVLGLALAARAARRGDDAAGFVLCAVTGLLISPVSWTHQWTLATPGLLLAVVAMRTPRRRTLAAAAALALCAGSWIVWVVIARHQLGLHLDAFGELAGNLYVIAGVGLLFAMAVREIARFGSGRRTPVARAVPAS